MRARTHTHTHMHAQVFLKREEERTPQDCTSQFPKLINNNTADTKSCKAQATLMALILEYWKQ